MNQEYYRSLYSQTPDLWLMVSAQNPQTKRFYRNYAVQAAGLEAALAADVIQHSDNLFVNFNPYASPIHKGRGQADDVAAICGVFLDVDVSQMGKYADAASERADLPEIKAAFAEWGLPEASAITFSGNGYHAEWRLDRPFVFGSEEDRTRAADFQRNFNAYAIERGAERGWKIDRMGDLPRVKRAVGSFNWKDAANPKPVAVVELHVERHYPLEALEAFRPTNPVSTPSTRPAKVAEPSDSKLPQWASIAAACPFIQHCMKDAATLPEPHWYAMLSIVAHCENGREIAHDGFVRANAPLGKGHPLGQRHASPPQAAKPVSLLQLVA